MGALFGSGNTNASSTPAYTQMQLQSSAYGVAIPIIYGTTRASWNLGDDVGFAQHQSSQTTGKGGVIGGGGKGGSSTQLTYSATIIGFICEGPITGIFSSWISQTQSAGTPGFTLFDGSLAQAAWSYFEDNFPDHALTYSGFVYAAAQDYDLGTSANLPNVNWEVQGFLQGTAPGTYGGGGCAEGGDADASLVVPDLLCNPQYGIGFPATRIGQVVNNNEGHSVPGGGGTITVTNAAHYEFNINVARDDGELFTCVGGTPSAALEYSYNEITGEYTFPSAAGGASIHIRYASLEALLDMQNFTLAAGLWISPAYTDQAAASSMLDDIATGCFCEFVWTSGVLTVVPRASTQVSGNGYTYTPPVDPLFSLTVDDFLPNSAPIGTVNSSANDDPVIVSRSRASDQINDVKIEYLDRANQYAPAIAEATDQAQIDLYGRRPGSSQSLHMFCDLFAANTSAHLQLQDQYIRNNYSFQLDERFILLDPMDIVELTDPAYPGLTNIPVRILEIQENDDGSLSYSAEEYPGTIGTTPEFIIDAAAGFIPDFGVDPGDAATPAVFDVPVQLVKIFGTETWLATHSATGNPNWGGCEVWLSTDNTTFKYADTLFGASRMGVLSANFATGSDPDTTHTLSVDLTESQGTLDSGTDADADNGDTICFVDGEYLSYSTATLTTTFNYDLGTYLRRGQWGSAISAHSSGALFVRLDNSVVKLPFTQADVGRTIYIKLLSFNIYGPEGGKQALSDVSSFSHVIGGPPVIYAPTGLTVTPVIKGLQLSWTNPPNIGIQAVEIWRSATSSFGDASKIADAPAYADSFLDQNGTTSGTQYWYWIRCRDIAGNEGAFDPARSGAGATNTSAQVGTSDISNGAVTGAKIANGAINVIAFASGITPVELFSSLPASGNFEGRTVFDTTDGQLYRYHSGAFTNVVPAVNISGTLTAAQIASITAAQITGQITTTQIANNSISTPLLQAGAVSSANIAAGTIVASNIASGTISGTNIAAGTLTATNLAANSVTSTQIAADAVVAGTLAVGAVNATAIVVNDILVTGQLIANAVSDSTVSVGSPTLIASGSGFTTLTSETKTLSGGNVQLNFTDYITWSTNGPRGFYRIFDSNGNTWMTVGYGGGSCPDFISSGGTGLDTSGQTGSVTYYLQANWTAGNQPTAQIPALVATELKR